MHTNKCTQSNCRNKLVQNRKCSKIKSWCRLKGMLYHTYHSITVNMLKTSFGKAINQNENVWERNGNQIFYRSSHVHELSIKCIIPIWLQHLFSLTSTSGDADISSLILSLRFQPGFCGVHTLLLRSAKAVGENFKCLNAFHSNVFVLVASCFIAGCKWLMTGACTVQGLFYSSMILYSQISDEGERFRKEC